MTDMNQFLLSLVTLVMCGLTALAQGTVRGKIVDKQTNEAIQYVNVAVTGTGGKLVKGIVTDAQGQFDIGGLADGAYTLQVSFVGYTPLTRQFRLTPRHRQEQCGTLFISEDAALLKEVQVTGQRTQMKLEVDRKVFTVDQVLAAAGGSASELLENIPSVEVTTDGEISLRGNSSVEVWLNGKPSGLTSDNRAEILQQIPAESIERIEVIDNPSAKYSPEGSAGIINIILKRDRKAGYYGSVRAGVNSKGGWNTGGNFNYSSGILDGYANLGYRNFKGTGGSESQQIYKQTNEYQNAESDNENDGHALFARLGLTWHFTDKDDLSVGGMTLQGQRDNTTTTLYRYGTVGAQQDTYRQFRLNSNEGDMRMYHAELAYEHRWTDKHKLSAHGEYNRWLSDSDNYLQDSLWYMDTPQQATEYIHQYKPLNIRNRSWEVKVDYENQMTEKFKLEMGYNGRFSHENTPLESWRADNWDGTGRVEDTDYYNRFIYSMDTHAFYATGNAMLGRLGVTAGLRGEYWKVDTESYDYAQEHGTAPKENPYQKDFFRLFPSVFFNYKVKDDTQLQLNYTYRLRRPWGGQLNSFKNNSDASMVQFGNPELTPEYTHSFSLNFLKTWAEHSLNVSTYYRPTTDVIQRIRYQSASDGLMYMTYMNLTKRQSLGVEVIGKNKLFRILDLTTTLNGYWNKLDGFSYDIDGQTVTGDGDNSFSWDGRMLASIILPYDINVQLTGNYRSRGVITQGYRRPNATLDFGLRKTFFNKQLALAFNVRDVFASGGRENYTESDTFWRHQKNWRDPSVNLQLTWNFSNKAGASKREENQKKGNVNNGGDEIPTENIEGGE